MAGSRSEHRARNERGGSGKRAFPSAVGVSAVSRGGRVGSAGSARLGAAGGQSLADAQSGGRTAFFLGYAQSPVLPLAVAPLAAKRTDPKGRQSETASGGTASGKRGAGKPRKKPPDEAKALPAVPACRPEPSRASRPDPTATDDG